MDGWSPACCRTASTASTACAAATKAALAGGLAQANILARDLPLPPWHHRPNARPPSARSVPSAARHPCAVVDGAGRRRSGLGSGRLVERRAVAPAQSDRSGPRQGLCGACRALARDLCPSQLDRGETGRCRPLHPLRRGRLGDAGPHGWLGRRRPLVRQRSANHSRPRRGRCRPRYPGDPRGRGRLPLPGARNLPGLARPELEQLRGACAGPPAGAASHSSADGAGEGLGAPPDASSSARRAALESG